jgi:hypothetical protein
MTRNETRPGRQICPVTCEVELLAAEVRDRLGRATTRGHEPVRHHEPADRIVGAEGFGLVNARGDARDAGRGDAGHL